MRKVVRKTTVPWCTCTWKRGDGYLAWPTVDSPIWVHDRCHKPSRLFWEGHAARTAKVD